MTKTPIIGLTGITGANSIAGCGKDTVAEMIRDFTGFEIYGLADPIYAMVKAGFGIDGKDIDHNSREAKNATIPWLSENRPVSLRSLLETLGTEWGREMICNDIWLKVAEQFIARAGKGVIIKDIRFPNESDWLNHIGVAGLGLIAPYVTVAPASVWFTKQLPAAQWVKLLARLPNGLTIVILGSASDRILGERIREELSQLRGGQPFRNLCGQLNIGASAAVMQRAVMNYANDSAPIHMASAVNAPVCAVFCSTVPSFGFGPLSERSFVVQTEEPLICRPCGLHGRKRCPEGHFRCATSITTEALLDPMSMVWR